MVSVRSVLVGLALAFSAYLAARGLTWTEPLQTPLVMIIALGLYLLTTWLCLLVDPPRASASIRDPRTCGAPPCCPGWAAGLAFLNALLVPSAVAVAVGREVAHRVVRHVVHRRHRRAHDDRHGAQAPLGGLGAAPRCSASAARCGSDCFPRSPSGLVGSVVWVAVAQLLVMSMDRAARDTAKLAELQQAASGWQASQAVRQRERRVRVQLALAVAGPVLDAGRGGGRRPR